MKPELWNIVEMASMFQNEHELQILLLENWKIAFMDAADRLRKLLKSKGRPKSKQNNTEKTFSSPQYVHLHLDL